MRRVIGHILLFIVVFIAGVYGINHYFGSDAGDVTAKMDQATLPVIYTNVQGYKTNEMHGYISDIDMSLLRESVTPLEGSAVVQLMVKSDEYEVNQLGYEVRSSDGSSLVENGEVTNFKEQENGMLAASVSIRMQLKAGQDYILKLVLKGAGGIEVCYYTRLLYNETMHAKEQLAFVKEFNTAIFSKTKAEAIQKYLESDANRINNDLGKVDITSSFDAITFAEMKPKKVTKPVPVITDITEDVACTTLNYLISSKAASGKTEYYEVTENYKVRYTADRMYLLSYDRTMNSLYDKTFTSTSTNSLKMGVSDTLDLNYMVTDDCKMAAFVKTRQLFLYDYQSTQVIRVFRFMQDETNTIDMRDVYNQHDIRLISIDEDGSLAFAVYGYMNRGRHEGQNGILFYRYDRETNRLEEIAFVTSQKPFSILKEEMKQAVYMTKNNRIYVVLGDEFYSINMKTDEVSVFASDISTDSLVSSADGHLVGIQKKSDTSKNKKITIYNLNDGSEQVIKAKAKEVIRVLGFVDDDLVYGRVKKSQIVKTDVMNYYPMYKVEIRNTDGEVVKDYATGKQDVFVMSAAVNKNVVEMKLAQKKGDTLEDAGSDYVMSKEASEEDSVTLDYSYNAACYNELYMIFPNYVYVTTEPQWNEASEVRFDDNRVVSIEADEKGYVKYFVYANGKVVDSYSNAAQAISTANEMSGVVVNSKQKTVWEKSGLNEYATVGEDVPLITAAKNQESMLACVCMILNYKGQEVTQAQLAGQDLNAEEMLTKYLKKEGINLTGCSLDEVMYYICQGRPVIAKNAQGRYVLLTSFNYSLLKYTDPVTGEIKRDGFAAMRQEFEEAGNVFYSYLE